MKKLKYILSIVVLLLISCASSETYDLASNGKLMNNVVAEEVVEVVEAKEIKPYMLEEGYDLISSDFRDKKEFERKEAIRIEKEKILAEEKRQEEIRLAEEAKKAEEARAEAARVEAAKKVEEAKKAEANKVAKKTQNNQQSSSSSEQKAVSSQETKPAAPAPKQAPVAQPAQPTSAQGQLVVRGKSFSPKSVQDRWAIQPVIDAGHVSYTNFNGTKMFFGHNPGVFRGITGLSMGDIISYSGRNYKVAHIAKDSAANVNAGTAKLAGMSWLDVAMNGAAGDALYLQFCEGPKLKGFLAYPIN